MKAIERLFLKEAQEVITAREIIARRAAEMDMTVQEYLHWRENMIRAKEKAKSIGLAYWPAIAYGPRIDPWAYAIAENILHEAAERSGYPIPRWQPGVSHGVWDSYGHHGVSPHDVARYWYAAGCRNNRKFRAQLLLGRQARPEQSVTQYINWVRGLRWLKWPTSYRLSVKAIEALGRLSPELRKAALSGLNPEPGRPVRTKGLNWDEVKRVQETLRKHGVRARAAMAGVYRACDLLGVTRENLPAALAPAFPRLPLELARRIALGESPVDLAGGLLTRREAHEWALDGAPSNIAEWLARHLGLPRHRSVRVIRWLQHCRESGRWNAIERQRTIRVPGEQQERAYSALDVLDEIQDEDIVTGRDSVDTVLRRAAERLGEAWIQKCLKDLRQLAPIPKWAERLPRWMRLLNTPAALAKEGKEMKHCVGSYVHAVERRQCYILSIETRQGRSTVELAPNLVVMQHRGRENGNPPPRNDVLLRAFLNRIHRQKALAAA